MDNPILSFLYYLFIIPYFLVRTPATFIIGNKPIEDIENTVVEFFESIGKEPVKDKGMTIQEYLGSSSPVQDSPGQEKTPLLVKEAAMH